MVKGSQKRVIRLKDTESGIFEEAYFIVKEEAKDVSLSDLISEANRIIERNSQADGQGSTTRKGRLLLTLILAVAPAAVALLATVIGLAVLT